MAHLRARFIQPILEKALQFSPLVGVIGHRQVGKTTVLEQICLAYATLDLEPVRKAATASPSEFVRSLRNSNEHPKGRLGPSGIDECQLAPGLFPALKEHVRKNKRPGQFLLSGSIRFTSRKAIRESLTGRIVNFELLPFTLAELDSEPLPDRVPRALESTTLEAFPDMLNFGAAWLKRREHLAATYFARGGMPGICFIRDDKMRDLQIRSQLQTLLDRDLRLIQKTSLPSIQIRELAAVLAREQGSPLDYRDIQSKTGISTPTIKKLLYALEGIFLLKIIPTEGGRKGFSVFFEDHAEAESLAGVSSVGLRKWIHLVFHEFRAQFEYRLGSSTEIFQYRTRGGAALPICFRTPKGTLGVLVVESANEARRVVAAANSFLTSYVNSKVLIVHPGRECHLLQPRILVAPIVAFT